MKSIASADLPAMIAGSAAKNRRTLVAIAGPPGVGKSTLSESLRNDLIALGQPACIVPMDGFHMDNSALDDLGLRQRKGAPQTFNAEAFVRFVAELRDASRDHLAPDFDRTNDCVRENTITIARNCRVVLVEGNYLLLDETPWCTLQDIFDITVFLSASMDTLRDRLVSRWIDHGYDPEAAHQKALGNDIPNAENVLHHSRRADVILDVSNRT
ncbi:AAA family ATPase [Hoeflea prorocentri]|uniref:AAA family ATPase n=1 Tax=Hoeflea prorocentri TaxID=1922333 RepID=A0A9X3ZGV7_9HYPH|nr:AAA family ATPase [Hoeflea prorocentri]MCY6381177.1 AAA family ATPase [Hoeflea prorocentri]MDA5398977.1 AAA family ATPase [Hoeflea prorocentri]